MSAAETACVNRHGCVDVVKIRGKTVVCVDLETTGLEADCGILQIAAKCGDSQFSRYVWPTKPITRGASEVNKISVSDDGRRLLVDGRPVDHVDCLSALRDFVDFVKNVPGSVILAAHNGRRFDFPRLFRAMKREGVTLSDNVVNLLDTWAAFRSLWPGQPSYKQTALVAVKLRRDAEPDAHNAAADVRDLHDLLAFVPAARHSVLDRFLDDARTAVIEYALGDLGVKEDTTVD